MNIVLVAGLVITFLTMIPVLLQIRSHPRGLFVLFFAEMWERFSYYGMRGLLIFFLTQHMLFSDKQASGTYGAYTTLVYLVPLVGGLVADRYLGSRKAVAFGALLLVAGHLTMAIEGPAARQTLSYGGQTYAFTAEGRGGDRQAKIKVGDGAYAFGPSADGGLAIKGLPVGSALPGVLPKGGYTLAVEQTPPLFKNVFYLALSLIIMGVGFLKANISAIVGQLYPARDPRRDSGFTLYYYGVNLGSFWAGILCGWLGQEVGWWAGFGLAGVGMLAGYLVFVFGRATLQGKGEPPNPERLRTPVAGPLKFEGLIYVLGLLGVPIVWLLVQHNSVVGLMLGLGAGATLAYIGVYCFTKATKVERERVFLAIVLTLGAVVFWTLFEQAGSSLNLFADRNTNLPHDGFFTVTSSQTQSFNPGFILIFAPVFAALWAWLGRKGRDPNTLVKFGLGLVQVGAGFLLLVWGAQFADAGFRLPMLFLLLAYLLHTTGELCLSPVGLSEISKLAPALLISTLMATWFLASSAAQYVGGFIAQMAGTETVGGQVLDPAAALATSIHVFSIIGWAGVAAGVLFFALSPFLSRWAHGVNDHDDPAAPEPFAPTLDGERQAVNPGVIRAEQGGA